MSSKFTAQDAKYHFTSSVQMLLTSFVQPIFRLVSLHIALKVLHNSAKKGFSFFFFSCSPQLIFFKNIYLTQTHFETSTSQETFEQTSQQHRFQLWTTILLFLFNIKAASKPCSRTRHILCSLGGVFVVFCPPQSKNILPTFTIDSSK